MYFETKSHSQSQLIVSNVTLIGDPREEVGKRSRVGRISDWERERGSGRDSGEPLEAPPESAQGIGLHKRNGLDVRQSRQEATAISSPETQTKQIQTPDEAETKPNDAVIRSRTVPGYGSPARNKPGAVGGREPLPGPGDYQGGHEAQHGRRGANQRVQGRWKRR